MTREVAAVAVLVLSVLACGANRVVPVASVALGERRSLAIVDVTVVPMDQERELPHQTVIVRGDRIAAVGPVDAVPVPVEARRIDGHGRFLIPGLVDMHVHLDRSSLALFVANGVTTVRNMSGRPRDLVWRAQIAHGELFGPTIFTTGPMIDGSPPAWNGSMSLLSPADAEAEVAREQRAGYDFLKVLEVLPSDSYDALLAAAHRHGMRVVGHVPVSISHALEAGQASIEHVKGYIGAIQADDSPFARPDAPSDERSLMRRGDYVDPRKLAAIAEATRAAGAWNCPTLTTLESGLPGQDTLDASRSVARFVSPATRATWDPSRNVWTRSFGDEDWQAARRLFAARERIVKALHDAGAKLLAGSDDPAFDAPGWSLNHELRHLAAAGLSPFEALAAATRDAAEFLRQEREIGRVLPGMRADLVLLEGDPLRDLANTERRAGVVLRGAWLPESDLRARTEAVAAAFEAHRDRLATFPSLRSGSTTFAWGVSANGVSVGVERAGMKTDTKGRTSWEAQQSVDDPLGADWIVEAETTPDGDVESLRIERRGDEEAGWVDLKRDGGRLVARGRLALAGDVTWEREVPPETVLLFPTPASYALLGRRIVHLAPGAHARFPALAFALGGTPGDPELELPPMAATLEVTGLPASRTYAIDVSAPNARYHLEMTLDGSGMPVEISIDRQAFEERHSRVPP